MNRIGKTRSRMGGKRGKKKLLLTEDYFAVLRYEELYYGNGFLVGNERDGDPAAIFVHLPGPFEVQLGYPAPIFKDDLAQEVFFRNGFSAASDSALPSVESRTPVAQTQEKPSFFLQQMLA